MTLNTHTGATDSVLSFLSSVVKQKEIGANYFSKQNYLAVAQEKMDDQMKLGNWDGYLNYSKWIQSITDATNVDGKQESMLDKIRDKIIETAEKIQNGETEPTFQIGGQSYTEEEWNKLIEKVDKNLDEIRAEQEERINKLKDKHKDKNESANYKQTALSGTVTAFNADTYSYFGTEGLTVYTKDGTPLAEKALTDQRYTDKETGISWYVGEDQRPYLIGKDAEKFNKMCKENGEFPLKKFAEMTGMIQHLDNNTTVYVGDNGIAVKGKDRSEYVIDIDGMSYDSIMRMLSQAAGGGEYYSDKYWNYRKRHL